MVFAFWFVTSICTSVFPFQIDFSHPFDISNSNKSISAIGLNSEGNILVAYTDSTISTYDQNFTLLFDFPPFSPRIIPSALSSFATTDFFFEYTSTINSFVDLPLNNSIITVLDTSKTVLLFFSDPLGHFISYFPL